MAKKLIVLLASVVLLAPVSVLAHAGHNHGEAKPKSANAAVQQTPSVSNQNQTELTEETAEIAELKEEIEKERLRADKRVAEIVTGMTVSRSSYIIAGLLFGAIGLVIRYLPLKEEE